MRALTAFFLSLSLAVAAWGQRADAAFDPVKDVSLRFEKGAVVVTVPEGAHLKASFMDVTKQVGPGTLKMGKLPPTTAKDELGDGIWHGSVRVPVSGAGLSGTVTLQVTYQPCTEGEGGVCYPPTTRSLEVKASEIPVSALSAASAEKSAGKLLIPSSGKAEERPKAEAPVGSAPVGVATQPVPVAPRTGLLLSLLLVFLAGMGASLTPCVYPMIPITMAIVGANSRSVSRTGEAGPRRAAARSVASPCRRCWCWAWP